MPPEKKDESTEEQENWPDPFAEPRDMALQWDVSAIWPEDAAAEEREERSTPRSSSAV